MNSKTLKFFDLIDFKTAQILYKARYKLLPDNIQNWFRDRDGRYELRGELNFKQPNATTTMKSMCISVHGVKFWNDLPDVIKQSKNVNQLKKMLKHAILDKYKSE